MNGPSLFGSGYIRHPHFLLSLQVDCELLRQVRQRKGRIGDWYSGGLASARLRRDLWEVVRAEGGIISDEMSGAGRLGSGGGNIAYVEDAGGGGEGGGEGAWEE